MPELDGEGSRIIPADPAGASGKSSKTKSTAAGGSSTAAASDSGSQKAVSSSGKDLAANGSHPSHSADAHAATGEADKPAEKPAPAEPPIVFLCPNGHKLNAPRKMQGHAGKCPHCGAKFRIPLADEAGSGEIDVGAADMSTFQDIVGAAAAAAAPGAYDHLTDAASAQRPRRKRRSTFGIPTNIRWRGW